MKLVLPLLAISTLLASAAFAEGVPSIHTGCFHFGPDNCDITSNPPTIDTGGFHFGPQKLSLRLDPKASLPKTVN